MQHDEIELYKRWVRSEWDFEMLESFIATSKVLPNKSKIGDTSSRHSAKR